MKQEVWEDWKRKTKREIEAIKAIKMGLKLVLNNIPKKEIISIYAKGSFIRREMKKNSDVDLFVVLKTKKHFKKLRSFAYNLKENSSPKINIGAPYTLWELKTGKKLKISGNIKPNPTRIIKHIPHYELIYGKDISKFKLVQKEDKILLNGFIHTFNSYFLPKYEKKEIYFAEIIKQVFWLVEFEQRAKGKKVSHSWKALAKSIKNPNHIIHDTLKYRKKKPKNKRLRAGYIRRLKTYLNKLEKELK
jgi:predicted nucleotidyltransferase